jgi:hypothetical protein
VLLFSFVAALSYAGYAALRISHDHLAPHLFYVVPIVVPFVAFLFDRAETFRKVTVVQFVVDAIVIATAMGRVVGNVPFVSGHTLFLTYCLLSARSAVPRLTAAIVLLQVIYLKYFVWHDWITSTSGIVLGALAAFVVWWFKERSGAEQSLITRLTISFIQPFIDCFLWLQGVANREPIDRD